MIRSRLTILVAVATLALAVVAPASGALVATPNDHPIVFESDRDGDLEIYVVNQTGDAVVQLTNNDVPDYDPVVSPDGQTIAFVSERDGSPALFRMTADGAIQSEVVGFADEGPSITIAEPTWSPDGTRIAFHTNRDTSDQGLGQAFNHEIYSVLDDGSDLTRLTNAPSANDGSPAWSPDGERIAFASDRDGDFEIYVMDASTGAGVVALTDNDDFDAAPDWAPDGSKLAFHSDRDGTGDVYVMTDAGAGTVKLTAGAGSASSPAYAPDGEQIVFGLDGDVWIMGADGSDPTTLTDGPAFDGNPDPAPYVTMSHPVGLVDPETGIWHLKDTDGKVDAFYYGNPGDSPFVGDWNCDGVDTPGLYRPFDGFVYLRNSNDQGAADIRFFFGNPGDIPVAGDFDGDGCDTVSVYRPSTGEVFIVNDLGSEDQGLGVADTSFYFGNPGDTPFSGDFDGDRVDTIGLFRESTGLVYYRNENTQGVADASFVFGNPGDRFVAADWTDTGIDNPGVFRPSDRAFYLTWVNAGGMADEWFPFYSEEDWLPIAGTFDTTP